VRIQLGIIILLTSLAVPCVASRTLKDELGRTVEVPDHPRRVICLIPSVVDIMYSLGAGAEAAASRKLSDHIVRNAPSNNWPRKFCGHSTMAWWSRRAR
jgi:ABC-type Fe3+-hydroxamate transport system substrate-binding protein